MRKGRSWALDLVLPSEDGGVEIGTETPTGVNLQAAPGPVFSQGHCGLWHFWEVGTEGKVLFASDSRSSFRRCSPLLLPPHPQLRNKHSVISV